MLRTVGEMAVSSVRLEDPCPDSPVWAIDAPLSAPERQGTAEDASDVLFGRFPRRGRQQAWRLEGAGDQCVDVLRAVAHGADAVGHPDVAHERDERGGQALGGLV